MSLYFPTSEPKSAQKVIIKVQFTKQIQANLINAFRSFKTILGIA